MLFNKLTDLDKKMIDTYINYYTEEPTINKDRASLEFLLRYWSECKERLYTMFGDNFILEKEIEFVTPNDQLIEEISRAYDRDDRLYKFRRHFRETIRNLYRSDLVNEDAWYYGPDLLSCESLAENKYIGNAFDIEFGGTGIHIPSGCKPIRMLGKIVKMLNLDESLFEEFRLAQSLYTNQKKLKGTLCLSIHPLDYMTMSDNDSGWSSCMSWQEEGCYRRGTVEMMNSPRVVVAYLKATNDMEFSWGDKWNNKKWRELFVVDEKMITDVKPYPYENKELTNCVLEWLCDLSEKNLNISYDKSIAEYEHDYTFSHKGIEFRIRMNCEDMYNDFGTRKHYCCISNNMYENSTYGISNRISMNYSGATECMYCGSADAYFDDNGYLLCDECLERVTCDCCGDCIEGDVYELDGENYCEYCFNEYAVEDPIDNDWHHMDNFDSVWILPMEANDPDNFDFTSTLAIDYPVLQLHDTVINALNNKESWAQTRANKYFIDIDGKYFKHFKRYNWGNIHYNYITTTQLQKYFINLFDYNSQDQNIYDEFDSTDELIRNIEGRYGLYKIEKVRETK